MTEANDNTASVSAGIPPRAEDRARLLCEIRRYVTAHALQPPLALAELIVHAQAILRTTGLSDAFDRYTVVLLSNEVWGEAFASVPFDRRLLLLPQCLRDRDHCTGTIDELGLVCAGCGACALHEFTEQAESLGYAVLISEGTTMAAELIARGQVRAVLGVSCLSALERIYPFMDAAGVPGLAVPLLRDGCMGTVVDVERVYDALHLRVQGREAVDVGLTETMRREVAGWFERDALGEVLGPARGRTDGIAREWLAVGGKRWRPLLAAGVYRALRGSVAGDSPDDLRKAAVAVECFHKASLIHDDIEDDDGDRYGEPPLHVRHGVPVALNVGDLLLGEGYRLIGELGCDAAVRGELLRVAARAHRELCLGQGRELLWRTDPRILTPGEVREIYLGKTAPAFEVAVHFGALLAGADRATLDALAAYSRHLGIAYQIRDDLTDVQHLPARVGAAPEAPSFVVALVYASVDAEGRGRMDEAWRRWLGGEGDADLLTPPQGRAAARRAMRDEIDAAGRVLESLPTADLRVLLRQVVLRIFHRELQEGTGEPASATAADDRHRTQRTV